MRAQPSALRPQLRPPGARSYPRSGVLRCTRSGGQGVPPARRQRADRRHERGFASARCVPRRPAGSASCGCTPRLPAAQAMATVRARSCITASTRPSTCGGRAHMGAPMEGGARGTRAAHQQRVLDRLCQAVARVRQRRAERPSRSAPAPATSLARRRSKHAQPCTLLTRKLRRNEQFSAMSTASSGTSTTTSPCLTARATATLWAARAGGHTSLAQPLVAAPHAAACRRHAAAGAASVIPPALIVGAPPPATPAMRDNTAATQRLS